MPIVTLSLKPTGGIPGDATDAQMDAVADLADRYGFGEVRVSHEQNLVLPDVAKADLYELWKQLETLELATPNVGLAGDIIACPGLDYCALANARSIPVAQQISKHFSDLTKLLDIGELKIKISGCINACGHHHVGHIGILGVDKHGSEFYQITLGGSADENAVDRRHRRSVVRRHRGRGRGRDHHRHLPACARRRRALPRHLPPRRPQALQGEALCRSLGRPAWSTIPGCSSRTRSRCRRPAR